jgi:hypothetical protein
MYDDGNEEEVKFAREILAAYLFLPKQSPL